MLPASLATPRVSARQWLAIAAAIGCGACGYAGLYPRFDDGALRIVIALTSIPFGAAVVATGVGARTPARAFWFTMLLASILGIASIIVPAAILARPNTSDNFFAMCVFGAFFGAPTGALYGLPLAILASSGHRHVHARSHEGTDRAAKVAGRWLIPIGLIALVGTLLLDGPRPEWMQDTAPPSRLPLALAGAALVAAFAMVATALVRLRRRSSWIDRVRKGAEPAFRLRRAEARDHVALLPHLGNGTTVVEWLPAESVEAASVGSAYRMAASGKAVAVIEDEHPIEI